MLRKSFVLLLLTVVSCVAHRLAAGAEPSPPASQWMPRNSVLAVELARPKALLDLALSANVSDTVTSLGPYKKAVEQPKFQQFLQVVRYLELRLGTDWKTGLSKLFGGGVHWAVAPGNANLLIVDAEDARLLGQLHDVFVEFAKAEAAKQG